jgi:hyperosmotically inducible periplasmic protein
MRISKKILVWAAASVLVAGPALADQPEDAYITSKVKMELLTAEGVNPLDINVDTLDGIVTLHGKVESPAAKSKAAEEARSVKGVKDVHNLIAVVPDSAKKQVALSDDQVQERVKTVLDRDAALDQSDIRVKSVNNGIVVLSGKADTLSSHERALADARAVDGVRKVASEIQSPNELGDKELWNDEPPSAGVTNSASDAWITTKVKVRLMAEPGLSPLKINVDTSDGIVTLFGIVNTEQEKASAEQQAKKSDGVKGVENELQVVPEVASSRVEARDDHLKDAVEKRLEGRTALSDDSIDVEVKNGVVRLTGTVDGAGERMTALTVARSTQGVKSVVDDLRVQTAQTKR